MHILIAVAHDRHGRHRKFERPVVGRSPSRGGSRCAWVLDKDKPLGRILRERGALADDEHALLEALVEKHLRKHGGDPERSLAAVGVAGTVRRGPPRRSPTPSCTPPWPASRPDGAATHRGRGPPATPRPGASARRPPPARFRILRPHARGGLGGSSWPATRSCTARWP